MTTIEVDTEDIIGGRRNGVVMLQAVQLRMDGDITILPNRVTKNIVNGLATIQDVYPGPTYVEITVEDFTRQFLIIVPSEGTHYVGTLILENQEYEPAVVSQVGIYAQQAREARNQSESFAGQAEGSKQAAETAQGLAEAARDAAEGFKNTAGQSAATATTKAGEAQTAKGLAEGARDAANSARDAAQGARDTALGYRNAAEGHKNTAQSQASAASSSASTALGYRNEAQSARDTALQHAGTATTQAGRAESEADRAEQAAANAEQGVPPTGWQKSDLHSGVQTSLGKADTASQPGHTHTTAQITDLDSQAADIILVDAPDGEGDTDPIQLNEFALAFGGLMLALLEEYENLAAADHKHVAEDIIDATAVGLNLMKAATQAAARSAIGAGTSSLVVGAGASNAKAGNWVPSWSEVTSKPASFPPSTHSHTAVEASAVERLGTATGMWVGTQAQYNALSTAEKNSTTVVRVIRA